MLFIIYKDLLHNINLQSIFQCCCLVAAHICVLGWLANPCCGNLAQTHLYLFNTHRSNMWFILYSCYADHSYIFWEKVIHLVWSTVRWTRPYAQTHGHDDNKHRSLRFFAVSHIWSTLILLPGTFQSWNSLGSATTGDNIIFLRNRPWQDTKLALIVGKRTL